MAEAEEIREGFLCPMCHKDLRSPEKLIAHFQVLHSEEQDILKSIKEFYGKAKKKILKLEDQDLETFKNELTLEHLYIDVQQEQELGCFHSHTDFFKNIRRDRLDHRTAETNKLIIRLDKLLHLYGADRKQNEQYLVAWVDGTFVKQCPSCAANFNIARRQHHCRLCGSIMCSSCSIFLPYDRAQSIVAPVQNMGGIKGQYSGKDTDSLRICTHCSDMLECRRRVQIEQMIQPIISQLYVHLQNHKLQIESQVDLYKKMYNSLVSGESTFHLQDAQSLKASIGSKAGMIDTISKKIAGLPVDEDCTKAQALQMNIRRAASNYIKDYILTLPALPTVQELANLKKQRLLRYEKEEKLSEDNVQIRKVMVETGWSPASFSNTDDKEEDPLVEQINIVREFIKQAREQHKFEELASLENNLKILKTAYQEQMKKEATDNK